MAALASTSGSPTEPGGAWEGEPTGVDRSVSRPSERPRHCCLCMVLPSRSSALPRRSHLRRVHQHRHRYLRCPLLNGPAGMTCTSLEAPVEHVQGSGATPAPAACLGRASCLTSTEARNAVRRGETARLARRGASGVSTSNLICDRIYRTALPIVARLRRLEQRK